MCGARPAAKAWEEDYAVKLVSAGFVRGAAAPTTFYQAEDDVSLVAHGDDFTAFGPAKGLGRLEEKMKEWYDMKTRGMLGAEEANDQTIKILNRKVEWCNGFVVYQADPKNIRALVKELGLGEHSLGLDAPMVVEPLVGDHDKQEDDLGAEEAKKFRRIASLVN